MSLLKWFGQKRKSAGKAPAGYPYYGARVNKSKGQLVFENGYTGEQELDFGKIEKISVTSQNNEHPEQDYWVHLWPFEGGESVSVPSRAGGFTLIKQRLSQLPGFDMTYFAEKLPEAGMKHVFVFERKPLDTTAKILSLKKSPAFHKLEQGLWLDHQKKLLPWGSFAALEKFDNVSLSQTVPADAQHYYKGYVLKKVSILHGIQVDALHTMTPSVQDSQKLNMQWPVTQFWSKIILRPFPEETFALLCRHLTRHWKKPDHYFADVAEWQEGNVIVRLHIPKESEGVDTPNYCALTIDYHPDLSIFYSSPYQESLQLEDITAFQTFPLEFNMEKDYTKMNNAYYTPTCFEKVFNEVDKSVIWVDKNERKIGFANTRFCRIFDLHRSHQLLLEISYWQDTLSAYNLYYRSSNKNEWQRLLSFAPTEQCTPETWVGILEDLTAATCKVTEDRRY